MQNPKKKKHIVLLAPHDSTLLDVTGPLDVFQKAVEYLGEAVPPPDFTYAIHLVSARKERSIDMVGGVTILAEGSYSEIDYPIDTLIVGGRSKKKEHRPGPEVLDWIRRQATVVRRVCSVCGGAFILAEAGVLRDKKAATHWMLCDQLAEQYPDTQVDRESIFVKDGNVYTSAGITSGMDLALALVEEDLGRSFALRIARIMVLFLKRPGNQAQFSTMLEYPKTDYRPVDRAVEWVYGHLGEEITVEKLADVALMSPRNFARVFVRELNITPMRFVEKLRLETACRYLTETRLTVEEIAGICGFRNSLAMNRVFVHTLHTTPTRYRKSFTSSFSH